MVKVIVYVEGGVVVGARADADKRFVDVEVFDFDNEKSERQTSKEAQKKADDTLKEYPFEIF